MCTEKEIQDTQRARHGPYLEKQPKAIDKETQMLDNFCLLFETGFLCVAMTVLELAKMLSQVLKLYDSVLGHVLDQHVYVCGDCWLSVGTLQKKLCFSSS